MSSERIKTMQEHGFAMGSCTAYALVAVGFDIPKEMFEMAIDLNKRRFDQGDLTVPSDNAILGLSGYADWNIHPEAIESEDDLETKIKEALDYGSKVLVKVDYGDGKNSHLVGVCELLERESCVIGGDLRFIDSNNGYEEIKLTDLYNLMTRNRQRHGGNTGDIFVIERNNYYEIS